MADIRKNPLSVETIKNDAGELVRLTTTALENLVSEYQFLYSEFDMSYKKGMELYLENMKLRKEIDQLKKQLEAKNE
jgi:hypothetical protein